MSLALDNKFIYPAHMMRSLKVHQLSDQFSKVMTCFHYFFLLLYSKFYLQVHFLIPSSNNLLTLFDFFFLRQVVLKFQILFKFAILCLPIRINKCHFKYSPVCNDHLTEYYLLDKYHRNR